jgi:hypothetical protein
MEFGKTEAVDDICPYNPHIIRETIKIIKHSQAFSYEGGCKQTKVWLYFFSSSQFFESLGFHSLDHMSYHTSSPTTTTTTTTTTTRYIYWLSSYFCFLHSEDSD